MISGWNKIRHYGWKIVVRFNSITANCRMALAPVKSSAGAWLNHSNQLKKRREETTIYAHIHEHLETHI